MKIHRDIKQGSEEWNSIRRGKLTASNADKILTPGGKLSKSADGYMMSLIAECFATPDYEKWAGNRFTDWGNAWEPVARQAFMRHLRFTGHCHAHLAMEEVGFCVMDSGVVGCSPDGLLFDGSDLVAGVEIKCPTIEAHGQYVIEGVLPDKYKPQVHFSMIVTGLPVWHFFSFFPGLMPLHVLVEQDDYTDKLTGAVVEFAEKYAQLWPVGTAKLQQTEDYRKAMEGITGG